MRAALCALAAGLAACAEPIYQEPDVGGGRAVAARFHLSLDPAALPDPAVSLAPVAGAVRVARTEGDAAVELRAYVKRAPNRPGVLWVELLVENHRDVGLGAAAVAFPAVGGDGQLYDLERDPFAPPEAAHPLPLGGVAARGVGRLMVGVTEGAAELDVAISATTTSRVATSSSPIAVTPDGAEVWSVVPDAGLVAVISTATDARVATIAVPAGPRSLAISSDGRLVVVASAAANTVTVIDRARRAVVQTFGEADGLGREPRDLVASPDGSRAYVSAYVGDRITALVRRGDRYEVEGSLDVGRRPTGMAVTPDGATLLVAHAAPRGKVTANEAWLTRIDAAAWRVAAELPYPDLLNLDRAHCLADVFGVSPSRMTAEGVPNQLAGVFLHPSGATGWVPHGVTAAIPVLERGAASVALSPAFDIRPAEFAPGFYSIVDVRDPSSAGLMLNPGALDRPVATSYLDCAEPKLAIEASQAVEVPGAPGVIADTFAAFPSAYTGLAPAGIPRFVGFSRGGRRALGLSYVSDSLAVFDGATMHPTTRDNLTLSGSQPLGLAVTPDGARAYVAYENSLFVSVLDLSALADPEAVAPGYVPYAYREVPELPGGSNGLSTKRLVRDVGTLPALPPITERAQIPVADADPLPPAMRRGKVLFASANTAKHPTLTALTMTACTSCHPDGTSDGTLWATMEGERRTLSLAGGVRGRGWLHASATHRDPVEFVRTIVTERLGGHLSEEDVQALAGYVADGIPAVQPPPVDARLAARGAAVYADRCAGCHDAARDDDAEPALHDVGTAIDDAHVSLPTFFESLFPPTEAEILHLSRGDRDLGPGDRLQQLLDFRQRPARRRGQLKAPTLASVHDQVLFFHDGRFDRLEDAVAYMDGYLRLGLSDDDRAAVVAYLRTR